MTLWRPQLLANHRYPKALKPKATTNNSNNMYAIDKMSITRAALLALGLMSAASAAPITKMSGPEPHGAGMAAAASSLVSRGPDDSHNGWATYYNLEEGTGACGWNNKNSEHAIAIGKPLWDSTSGQGRSNLCGKTATVRWHGKSVKVRVVDECPSCGYNDIDLSPSAFEQLDNKDVGKLNGINWKFD